MRERGRTYTKAEVNRLLEQHVARIRELAAENKSLGAQVTGLLAQLADAEDALLQIDADTKRLGRAVREYAGDGRHPSLGGVPEREGTRARSNAYGTAATPPASGGTSEGAPPARLRLVSPVTSTEGKQT